MSERTKLVENVKHKSSLGWNLLDGRLVKKSHAHTLNGLVTPTMIKVLKWVGMFDKVVVSRP